MSISDNHPGLVALRDRAPVIYQLSEQHRKELLLRHTEITIALPVPPHEVEDPVHWARSVLPTEVREMVATAEETELYVSAIRTLPPADKVTLTDHLGRIVDDPEQGDRLLQCVMAIVITLRPPECRRQSKARVRWPKSVRFHGQQLP